MGSTGRLARLPRRLLLPLVASLLLAALAQPALAGEEWCEFDPTMLLTTPHGNHLLVYVTQSGYGLQHLVDLEAGTLSYASAAGNQTDANGNVETLFHVYVTIPNDLLSGQFATMVQVSTLPMATGAIYATASGTSGTVMDAAFTVDMP